MDEVSGKREEKEQRIPISNKKNLERIKDYIRELRYLKGHS